MTLPLRNHLLRISLATLVLLGFVLPASAQVTEAVGDHGAIDWSGHTVQATGISVQGGVGGRAGQIRAAKLDALRQILETIKGIRISSETTVEEYMLSSDRIRTTIEGVARNYQPVGDPVYQPDGSIELVVSMNMLGTGHLYDSVLQINAGGANPVYTTAPQGTGVFTGLIVDTRGLGVRPALAPRIIDDRNQIIYGERYVDRQWVIENGMVGYAGDTATAMQDDRVGTNPLIIKAVDASGAGRADVVIGYDDARRLHAIEKHLTFLQQARVVFVVDQE